LPHHAEAGRPIGWRLTGRGLGAVDSAEAAPSG
jgi:hypothetical protein